MNNATIQPPKRHEDPRTSPSSVADANADGLSIYHRVLVTIFLVSILVISVLTLSKWKPLELTEEHRAAAPVPQIPRDLQELLFFPFGFDAFFRDRLAFRTDFLFLRNTADVNLFKMCDTVNTIVGKGKWFFYKEDADAFDGKLGRMFTPEEMADYAQQLDARNRWLNDRGIRYVFVIAPTKASIYPEYLPPGFERPRLNKKVDSLVSYLKDHTGVKVIDLRDVERANKDKGELYYALDGHWNTLGAYYGYREITSAVSKWFPQINQVETGEFKVETVPEISGDLSRNTGLRNSRRTITNQMHSSAKPKAVRTNFLEGGLTDRFFETRVDDVRLPRAVVLRDSMTIALAPFLSEHFSKMTYIWPDLSRGNVFRDDLVVRDKPDVVVHVINERYFINCKPINEFGSDLENSVHYADSQRILSCRTFDQARNSLIVDPGSILTTDSENRIVVDSHTSDPQIHVPLVAPGPVRVKLEMITPADSTVEIFYTGPGKDEFSPEYSMKAPTHLGYNALYFDLPGSTHGKIRIDPAPQPGKYFIENIELYQLAPQTKPSPDASNQ